MGTIVRVKSYQVAPVILPGEAGRPDRLKLLVHLDPETSMDWRQLFVDRFNDLGQEARSETSGRASVGDSIIVPTLTDNIGSFFVQGSRTVGFLVAHQDEALRDFAENYLLPAVQYANQRATRKEIERAQQNADALLAEMNAAAADRNKIIQAVADADAILGEVLGVDAIDAL